MIITLIIYPGQHITLVVGASNHAEIWDKSRWDAECAKLDSDDIAGIMDELGF